MTLPRREAHFAAILREAEENAPRVAPRPLSLADLEARERRQRLTQLTWPAAAAALLLFAWQPSPWTRSGDGGATPAPAPAAAQALARAASQAVQDVRASMDSGSSDSYRAQEPTGIAVHRTRARANAAIERALTNDFRINFRLAEAGDLTAWVKLQRLSRRHPDSHGGQCARAYLASKKLPNESR